MLETEMSAMEIDFGRSADLGEVRINKNDLIKLIELIKGSFPNENDINCEIRTNYNSKSIKTDNINEFLSINDLPNSLKGIEIRFFILEKYIYIVLAPYRKHLSISGNDEAWVIGNFHKILSFISNKRPWFYSRKYVYLFYFLIIGLLGGVTSYLFINKYVITAILFACVIFAMYTMPLKYIDKYFPTCEIRLSPMKSIINKDMITIIMMALSLIVAVIGGIIIPILNK